ncbi:MAG: hypothetical protein QF685_07025 [Verrucomicrobiota bacterium]|jgi:uncharacterized repeat protein (TIGR04138 family)|nr:hypothetical protein [Verrucomicrobiota bacterium]
MIHKQSYDEVLDAIIASDPRYHRDAFHFVREGLDYTQQTISKQEKGIVRHISGQELLGGMRAHALEEYGPMALVVLNEWGVSCCEDFGEIVFTMIEYDLLARTAEDSRDDFKGSYSFDEAFRQPFLPPEPETAELPSTNRTIAQTSGNKGERSNKPVEPEASDKQ